MKRHAFKRAILVAQVRNQVLLGPSDIPLLTDVDLNRQSGWPHQSVRIGTNVYTTVQHACGGLPGCIFRPVLKLSRQLLRSFTPRRHQFTPPQPDAFIYTIHRMRTTHVYPLALPQARAQNGKFLLKKIRFLVPKFREISREIKSKPGLKRYSRER